MISPRLRSAQTEDLDVRSADQDGHVMVLRTPRTPADLPLDAAIAVDWRPADPW